MTARREPEERGAKPGVLASNWQLVNVEAVGERGHRVAVGKKLKRIDKHSPNYRP